MSNDKKTYIVILGTSQDAGVPQLGCDCANCTRAVRNKRFRQLVTCIGIINPKTGKSYIVDATPNIVEQVALLTKFKSNHLILYNSSQKRLPISMPDLGVDGIFLTHAHMGHYLGLIQLGKEASAVSKMPIYATASMIKFLNTNRPFKELIKNRNIVPNKIFFGKECLIEPNLSITPFPVEHRHEYSDTVGFLIKGAEKQLLYAPDMDFLTTTLMEKILNADVALIDGTFYDNSELSPHRVFEEVRHPIIIETVHKLRPFVKKTKIYYTHFNHTNPLLDSNSKITKKIEALGLGIARSGQAFKI